MLHAMYLHSNFSDSVCTVIVISLVFFPNQENIHVIFQTLTFFFSGRKLCTRELEVYGVNRRSVSSWCTDTVHCSIGRERSELMLLSEWWAALKGWGWNWSEGLSRSRVLEESNVTEFRLSHTNQGSNPGSEEVGKNIKIPEQNSLVDETMWNTYCFKEWFFSVNKGWFGGFFYNNISEVFISWYIVLLPEFLRSQKVVWVFFLFCLACFLPPESSVGHRWCITEEF